MRTKFSGILTLFLALVMQFTFAQEKTITGTVSDETGPLPGVSIVIKGTTTGTETDFDGNYSINASVGDVLVYSFVGMTAQEKTVGAANTINVVLVADNVLDEVVVTALGIQRQARAVGYGTDVVKGEDLIKARESNIVNSLQGKVTGVQITNTGGNLGGSSKIVIRGVSSLSGRNTPLWIVDGIIINDNQTGTTSRISGNRDFGNGAAAINPDDVESMNVLKGAAATALYGSRAAAGAIIVTTKKGKVSADGNARVSINSTVRFDNLFRTPDYQQEYAMGTQGKYDSGSVGFDWGPRIDGAPAVDNLPVTGEPGFLTAVDDNGINDFFKTGFSYINNIAISDASERGDYRISLTSLNQTGILPGSKLDRLTANFNAGFRHSDKLESRFSAQYVKTKSAGTGATGANDPNIIGLGSFSSTLDQRLFTPWIDASGNQINHIVDNQGVLSNNPQWIRNENSNDRNDDRFIGNFSMTFKPFEGFGITGRVGLDFEDDKRFIENSKGTINRIDGNFIVDEIRRNIITTDVFATYQKDISDDFSFNILGGFQYNARLFERQSLTATSLLIPELFSPGNAEQTVPGRGFSESRLIGLYGSAEFGYKNWATLTLTARNDWSSTLPTDNNSYFYPSASLAFVFTDAFGIDSDWISYGKLRASWAQVGNDAGPYQLDFNFNPVSTATGQYSLNLNFPFNGVLAYSASNTIPPDNLVPEEQTSYEVGMDAKLFKGRLGLDVSYFKSENKNQILAVPVPETTGFSFAVRNVGQVDQEGFEIAIDATPIRVGDFSWNTAINYSLVESEVIELVDGVDRLIIASAFNSVQVVAVPGQEFQLFAFDHLRDPSGRPIIDPTTGRRIAGEAKTFGSVLPDWTGGWINTFTYKGLSLTATVDVKWGGIMKSSTVEGLQTGGLVTETLRNREGTFIDTDGVLDDGNGNFTPNNVPLLNAQDFWTSLNDNSVAAPYIYDASFVKLREVGISYTLPSKVLEKTFIKSATFGVEGRNLALLYSEVPHIDPEANLFGSGADGFGVERASIPSTRSIGFNVRLTF